MPKTAKPKPDLKQIRLVLSPEQQHTLRIIAAQAGQSMSVFVRELVEREIDRKTGDKKLPK